MYDEAFRLIAEIKKLDDNAEAYIVGGAVRDYILGVECDDIDIATSVDINTIEEHFETHDIGKNKDFGIVVVVYEGNYYEIANYRVDGTYSDGRRPDSVEIVSTFEEDTKRRDFTINAMGLDENGDIIDFHNGTTDLGAKVIRTVGPAANRFEEDQLRMLRAIRFSARLGFEMDKDIREFIAFNGIMIKNVSVERIWKELLKMAEGENFYRAIEIMQELGFLQHVLPEIAVMNRFPHYKRHHPEGNVWQHTVAVCRYLEKASPIVKLAGLFHDIGKPIAYEWFPKKGKYHYLRHDFLGLDVFKQTAERLKLSKEITNEISYCIKNHMRMHQFLNMRDSKCCGLIDHPHWESLYAVAYADDSSRLYEFEREFWNEVDIKVARLKDVIGKNKYFSGVLNGNTVMILLDLKGGKKVGDVLNKAKAHVIDKNIDLSTDKGIETIHRYIKQFK